MRDKLTTILGALSLLALAGTIASCGNGPSLTTGSILGGPSTPSGPKPVTASDRALYVGATVARAQRCGFYFDPDQVRANYLASEAQAGTAPELVQRATKEFDTTRQSVLAVVVKDESYCTEGRNREVKAALTRQLAGDFNPPRRAEVDVKWFEHQAKRDVLKGDEVFDRAARPRRGNDD